MKLLNCKRCDDVVKLVDNKTRSCECGLSSGRVDKQDIPDVTGPARVIELPWQEYDQASDGAWYRWRMVAK